QLRRCFHAARELGPFLAFDVFLAHSFAGLARVRLVFIGCLGHRFHAARELGPFLAFDVFLAGVLFIAVPAIGLCLGRQARLGTGCGVAGIAGVARCVVRPVAVGRFSFVGVRRRRERGHG